MKTPLCRGAKYDSIENISANLPVSLRGGGIFLLKFEHLDEAISKAAFLNEFCFGVRIVRFDGGEALYSSVPLESEVFPACREAGEKGRERSFLQARSEKNLCFGKDQEAYEITSVPVLVGDQRCALEMIQPHRSVISAVSGEPKSGLDGEAYLSGALSSLILRDTLTGLYNRRYIDEFLPAAMSAAYSRGQPLSLIFTDIDHFKFVNDRYGHITGDLVLQHVAQLLKNKIRRTDSWVARYGGDEFVICLPGVDNSAARRIANRLRVAVMVERFPLGESAVSLTCSFGVHTLEKGDSHLTALMLLHQVDEKLYLAKHAGKNTVVS